MRPTWKSGPISCRPPRMSLPCLLKIVFHNQGNFFLYKILRSSYALQVDLYVHPTAWKMVSQAWSTKLWRQEKRSYRRIFSAPSMPKRRTLSKSLGLEKYSYLILIGKRVPKHGRHSDGDSNFSLHDAGSKWALQIQRKDNRPPASRP